MKFRRILIVLLLGFTLTFSFFVYKSFNYTDVERRERIETPRKILVISPHIDDEMIIAGCRMIQNRNLGGENWVVYLTYGTAHGGNIFGKYYFYERRREGINAMKTIGIRKENLIFLGKFNQKFMGHPKDIGLCIRKLEELIKKINPDEIFTSAYEGGHCLHDLANFITYKAIVGSNWRGKFYESTEYNQYISLSNPAKLFRKILQHLSYISPIKFQVKDRPFFIPEDAANNLEVTEIIETKASKRELKIKLKALSKYRSQNLNGSLIGKFSYPEKYRLYPGHNYCLPPMEFGKSINFKLKKIFNRVRGRKFDNFSIKYSICETTFTYFKNSIEQFCGCD